MSLAGKGHNIHLISLTSRPFREKSITHHTIPATFAGENRATNILLRRQYVRRLLNKISPDVLMCLQTIDYGFLGALMRFSPFVVFAYGSDVLVTPFLYKNKGIGNKGKALVWKCVNMFVFKKADRILAEPTPGLLLKKAWKVPNSKLVPIIWGADTEIYATICENRRKKWREKLSLFPGQPVIVMTHSLKEIYRPEILLRSLPLVIRSLPDTVVIFLKGSGTREYCRHIKALARSMGVDQHIRVVEEFLPPEEVAALLHLSDILVSIPMSESFPLTALEGALAGCISILSDIPGNRSAAKLGLQSFFVSGDNEKELAETIKNILQADAQWKRNILARNKNWVLKNATWDITVNRVEALLQTLSARGIGNAPR